MYVWYDCNLTAFVKLIVIVEREIVVRLCCNSKVKVVARLCYWFVAWRTWRNAMQKG